MDRRILKTKKAIKNAYLTLLEKKDYADISVKELVDLADINRSTFYLHYYDINQVFEELIDEVFEKVSSAIPEEGIRIDEIDTVIGKMNEVIKEDHDHSLIISRASDYPYFSKSLLAMMKEKTDSKSLISNELNEKEKELLMEILSYMTYSITNYLVKNYPEDEIDTHFEVIREHIFKPVIEDLMN